MELDKIRDAYGVLGIQARILVTDIETFKTLYHSSLNTRELLEGVAADFFGS